MTVRPFDAVGAAIAVIQRVRDPRSRLRAAALVRNELDRHSDAMRDLVRATVGELRRLDPPATLAEIAEILSVSVQRAHQLAADAEPTSTTEGTEHATHR